MGPMNINNIENMPGIQRLGNKPFDILVFIGLLDIIGIGRGGQYMDSDPLSSVCGEILIFLQKLPPIHARHIDIQEDNSRLR